MITNHEGADSFESEPQGEQSAPSTPSMDSSLERAVIESREGGKNAEAVRIATLLAGGKPSKAYIESVRQGLEDEDH